MFNLWLIGVTGNNTNMCLTTIPGEHLCLKNNRRSRAIRLVMITSTSKMISIQWSPDHSATFKLTLSHFSPWFRRACCLLIRRSGAEFERHLSGSFPVVARWTHTSVGLVGLQDKLTIRAINGHKVLTYQSTRECRLGSLLNSVHMKLTKITQCPVVYKAKINSIFKSIQALHSRFFTGTPPFSRSFNEVVPHLLSEEFWSTQSAEVCALCFVQRHQHQASSERTLLRVIVHFKVKHI